MFKRSTSPSAPTEGETPKRQRKGRGLGPFTSGHLTIIIATVVIVVAFPFRGWRGYREQLLSH
jgi:hypothetical protein